MSRLWRLLQHLFGDEPPPRPHPHSHRGWHLRHRRHHDERDEDLRRQGEEQVADAADDALPPQSHGH